MRLNTKYSLFDWRFFLLTRAKSKAKSPIAQKASVEKRILSSETRGTLYLIMNHYYHEWINFKNWYTKVLYNKFTCLIPRRITQTAVCLTVTDRKSNFTKSILEKHSDSRGSTVRTAEVPRYVRITNTSLKPKTCGWKRTKFTPNQLAELEKCFDKSKYLDKHLRAELMERTGMPVSQISKWFRNRRTRWRNTNDALTMLPGSD